MHNTFGVQLCFFFIFLSILLVMFSRNLIDGTIICFYVKKTGQGSRRSAASIEEEAVSIG